MLEDIPENQSKLEDAIKRLIDITVSAGGIAATSPLLLTISIINYVKMGNPVIFTQKRGGLNGELFKVIKFRTMKDAVDKDGNQLPDSERLTAWGQFLRSSSLDELPTLLNVLKGDMSLVGPRPLLAQYVPLYNKRQFRRLSVKPGITGWAQVNGRNAISWEQKFEYDIWYIENRSLLLDFKIVLKTVMKVLKRSGISQDNHATMEYFTGSSESSES